MLGSKTQSAIRRFQGEHGLPPTGTITTPTYNLLVESDMGMNGPVAPNGQLLTGQPLATGKVPDFYGKHSDFYGHTNPQYADPMTLSSTVIGDGNTSAVRTQSVPSRYAKLDVSENSQGSLKTYAVVINGQPLLRDKYQPSVIGISRTFELNNEDAIIFSTFRANDSVCSYKHYLLTLREGGQNLQEIGNCTRGFQAQVTNNSLFMVFPESDDGRTIGNTWRYHEGDLERL